MKSNVVLDEIHEVPEEITDSEVGKESITEEESEEETFEEFEEESEEQTSEEFEEESEEETSEEFEEEFEEETSFVESKKESESGNEKNEIQSEYDSYTTIDYTSKLESIENSLKFNSLVLIGLVFIFGLLMGLKKL